MQRDIPKNRNVTILFLIVPFLMGMGIDLYVPSLPAITDYFNVSSHLVQLTVGFYMLGYAIGQIFLGILSDSFGRRKIIIISSFFYTVISFLAIFSPNIYLLIFYRFLQGLGIAGLGVAVRSVASDIFTGINITKALTTLSLSWALGPIVGPFIGGYIQHYFNWKIDFYLFAFYGLSIFLFSLITLPETHVNLISFHPKKILLTLKEIICNPLFLLGAIIASLAYSVLVIFNVIGPFLIQDVMKYSAIDYGRIALILGIAYFLGNTFNRFIIHYIEPTKVASLAIISALIISLLMTIFSFFIEINLWIIFIPSIAVFFFCGLILPNMVANSVRLYPQLGGTANAVVGSLTAGGVFAMTSIATIFKAQSQIPLAMLYVAIALISAVLLIIFQKLKVQRSDL